MIKSCGIYYCRIFYILKIIYKINNYTRHNQIDKGDYAVIFKERK